MVFFRPTYEDAVHDVEGLLLSRWVCVEEEAEGFENLCARPVVFEAGVELEERLVDGARDGRIRLGGIIPEGRLGILFVYKCNYELAFR